MHDQLKLSCLSSHLVHQLGRRKTALCNYIEQRNKQKIFQTGL
nr:MAG TPA: hypothetical protein [Bacteriophage sp.]